MTGFYNEQGEYKTLEQVFHLLSTRLYEIHNGRIKKGNKLLIDNDYEEQYIRSILRPIISEVFSFPPSETLNKINYFLERLQQLKDDKLAIVEKIDVKDNLLISTDQEEIEFKQEMGEKIEHELNYYSGELMIIKDELSRQVTTTNDTIPTKNVSQIELPSDIKFKPVPEGQISVLDKYQSALLFHFLKEKGAIKQLSDTALAQIISLLTGHSEPNIRQQALGRIYDVMTDKVKNKDNKGRNHNLTAVANLLESILSDIKKEMKK